MRCLRRHVSIVLLVAIVTASTLTLTQVEASTITEWTIPTALSGPHGVFVDDDLSYFTALGGDRIGYFNTSHIYLESEEEIIEEKTLKISVRTIPDLLFGVSEDDYRTEFTPGESIRVDGYVKDEEDRPVEGAEVMVTFLMYEGSTYAGEKGSDYPRRTDRSGHYWYVLSSVKPEEYAFVGRWELIVDASKEGYKDARVSQEIEMKKGRLQITELRTYEAFASYDPGGTATFQKGSSLGIGVDVQNQYGVLVRGARVSFTITMGQGRTMEMGAETTSEWGHAAMIIDIGGEREYAGQQIVEDEELREGEWFISVTASMKGCEEDTASTTVDVWGVAEDEAESPEDEAETVGYKHPVDYVVPVVIALALAWGVYRYSKTLPDPTGRQEREPSKSVRGGYGGQYALSS